MERKARRRLGAAFLAAAAVTTAVTLAATSVTAGEVKLAFEMRNADLKITFLDFNRNGRGDRGDEAVAVAPLRDDRTGKRVGRAFVECTVMSRLLDPPVGRGVWVCSYVLRLARGQITLQGRDPAGPGSYALAVTGGTGRFRDARGQAALQDFSNRTEFVVQLEP